MSILQRLYDSEVNFRLAGFYDAGFDVQLGDALNGFIAEGKVETWAEVEAWLRSDVLFVFTSSLCPSQPLGSSTVQPERDEGRAASCSVRSFFFCRFRRLLAISHMRPCLSSPPRSSGEAKGRRIGDELFVYNRLDI
jgi:hypothetical protein